MTLPRPRSIRARSVVSAGVIVLLGAGLISVIALAAVRGAASRSIDDALAATVSDVNAQLVDNPPTTGTTIELPQIDARNPTLVQVVDSTGVAVATTPGISSTVTLCDDIDVHSTKVQTVDLAYPHASGTFRVLAQPVTASGHTYTVCAARSDEQAESTTRTAFAVLALVVPAITLLVCLLVARQVGRALTAVSELSNEADRLRSLETGRLGVPDTGDEVEALALTLNQLLDRLHDQSRTTQRFIADAGHELRTPLTSLSLALELAPRTDDDWMLGAHQDLDRLTELVDDLLALARTDSGAPQHLTAVSVPADLLDEVDLVRRLRPELDIDVEGDDIHLLTDAPGLRRAVRNLLTNASRHAVDRVTLTSHEQDGFAIVEVADDGPGIPADQVERVFDRFVRLDPARARDDGGSGLGLSIVASFAKSVGGDATARPGPGGSFTLRVPLEPSVPGSRGQAGLRLPS